MRKKDIYSKIKKSDADAIVHFFVEKLIPYCSVPKQKKELTKSFQIYAKQHGKLKAAKQVLLHVTYEGDTALDAFSDKNIMLFYEAMKMHMGLVPKEFAITPDVKAAVFKKYKHTCQFCNFEKDEELEIDHIIPRSIVGNTLGILNLRPIHKSCNKIKGTHIVIGMFV